MWRDDYRIKSGSGTDLFLGSEVVDDIEKFPDFLRRLSLDHVRHSFAPDIPKRAER